MYLESKTLKIEGDLDWVQRTLKIDIFDNEKIHNLASVRCALEECVVTTEPGTYGFGRRCPTKRTASVNLREVVLKPAEVVAAEEAVRKAQESLKAAEEVLNKVKKEK